MQTSLIESLNGFAPFAEMAELMDDEQFTDALATIVKMMANPDIPPGKAPALIVKLQAYSAKFSMYGTYFINIDKKNREKKNIYLSLSKALDELVGAIKYTMRNVNYG